MGIPLTLSLSHEVADPARGGRGDFTSHESAYSYARFALTDGLPLMRKLLASPIPIAPLVVFRVLFGFIMAVSVLRFALKGWIDALYVRPTYHFTFYGFDWVAPLGEGGMYALYGVMGLAALGIMLGWRYRIAVAVFFLAFTYVELIDKANYLNHYYFVSVVSFLLFWAPAHRAFSLDVRRKAGAQGRHGAPLDDGRLQAPARAGLRLCRARQAPPRLAPRRHAAQAVAAGPHAPAPHRPLAGRAADGVPL